MKKFILTLALAVGLSGCALWGNTQTPQQVVYAAKASFSVAQDAALEYLSWPYCTDPVTVLPCRTPDGTKRVKQGEAVAKETLDDAEAAVRDPNWNGGVEDKVVVAATNAVSAYKNIVAIVKGE